MPLINWVKTHKLIGFLILAIVVLLLKDDLPLLSKRYTSVEELGRPIPDSLVSESVPDFSLDISTQTPQDTTERIVIKNSNLSLLVKDVREAGDQILEFIKNKGGFMVTTSYNRPDESPFATITVRVPIDGLDASLDYFQSLAIKVVSENLVGRDVTEEFTDIESRLTTLEKTKVKFESILEKATKVQKILTVQREIINLQRQIDSLKGQRKALEQNAKLTKVTIFLSTDELALPYTPDKSFRPNVVFKKSVRSLLGALRIGGEALIWTGVYSVIWGPALITFFIYRRWRKRKQPPTT